jgi:outer membrane protein OmpA-like peptidoglycan-associated protein
MVTLTVILFEHSCYSMLYCLDINHIAGKSMELYVKIFNGELIQVFNTSKDKKKRIILTTISDFQEEAEVEFFVRGKKVRTIIFTNLPPAKARVLNLPVIIQKVPGHKLEFSYVGNNKKTERFEFNFKPYRFTPAAKNAIITAVVVGLLGLLAIPIVLFIRNFAGEWGMAKSTTTTIEKPVATTTTLEVDDETTTTTVENNETDQAATTTIPGDSESRSVLSMDKLVEVVSVNSPLYFLHDSDTLLENEPEKLDAVIREINRFSSVELRIEGHSQNIGEPENEKALSRRRAGTIKAMITEGCPEVELSIDTEGFGSTRPAVNYPPRSERFKNRRVEISVVDAE